jgi:hypothetical protein
MPLAAPDDLEEGVIVSVGKLSVRVIFPEKKGDDDNPKISATVVTMRPGLIRPR